MTKSAAAREEMPLPMERRRSVRMRAKPLDLVMETAIFSDTVRLLNIGRLGFSVSTPIAYASGTALRLLIPGHDALTARAVWFARNQLGARLDEPLEEYLLFILTEED